MKQPALEVRTGLAHLVRTRPDLLEIRYHKGCTLTAAGVSEVQEARRRLMGKATYGMLTVLPEDVDFNLDAMQLDHLQADRMASQVLATAVVARANMIQMMVKLYFSYFPQLHRILVTDNEDEAREWMEAQLEEVGRTGS